MQQVPAVNLTAPRNLLRNPGSPVYFPHTVQNTGNGPDRFNLTPVTPANNADGTTNSLAGGAPTVIYADANRDGVPDSQTPLGQTPTLAPGETFSFVVGDVVPTNTAPAALGSVTVNAASALSSAVTAANADTVTATAGAVVALRKSVSSAGGAPNSSGYTYSLRYTNSGTAASGRITVTDTLPAGLTYTANSGTFNRLPANTPPTDSPSDGFQGTGTNSIDYRVNGNTITFIVPSVPAGQDGLVTFGFSVAATATPGIARNTAQLRYDDNNDDPSGAGTAGTTPDVNDSSNTVDFSINRNTQVSITDDKQTVAVAQGGTAVFTNTVTNNGTGTDSFNVTVQAPGSFPAGTSFQLFKPDGQSPLLDTNSDGIPDTGPLAPGGSYNVIVKATLPPGSTSASTLSVTVTATSVADATKNAVGTDSVPSVTAATVNIANATPNAAGVTDSEDLTVTVATASGNPGATTTIPLTITNNGGRTDSYVLSANNTAPTQQGAPGSGTGLPTGYSVVFQDPTTGALASNINNIAAGTSRTVNAVITIPAGAPAGTVTPLYFTATSPTTGASNTIHDAVNVNSVRAITVAPNLTGQVFPGSSVSYVNVVKNNGNQTESNIAVATSGDGNGFTSVVYLDANNNGTLEANETTPITSIASLAAGASQNLIVRVFGPSSTGQVGQTNPTTVTATLGTGQSGSATDTTTLVVGDVTLVKSQAVAARAANGTYPAFGTPTQNAQIANPGDRVLYSIQVTNTGATPVDNVKVFDSLPAYTTFVAGSATGGTPVPTAPDATNNSLFFTIGTLAPGASTTVTFQVQIDG